MPLHILPTPIDLWMPCMQARQKSGAHCVPRLVTCSQGVAHLIHPKVAVSAPSHNPQSPTATPSSLSPLGADAGTSGGTCTVLECVSVMLGVDAGKHERDRYPANGGLHATVLWGVYLGGYAQNRGRIRDIFLGGSHVSLTGAQCQMDQESPLANDPERSCFLRLLSF